MRTKLDRLPVVWAITVLAGGIFALHLWFALGAAVPILYVAVVLVSSWSPHRRFTFLVAAGCSILTILGLILSALHNGTALLFPSVRELSETRLTG